MSLKFPLIISSFIAIFPFALCARQNMSFDFSKILLSIHQRGDSTYGDELKRFLNQECDSKTAQEKALSPICRQIEIRHSLAFTESQISRNYSPVETRRGWEFSDIIAGWWNKKSFQDANQDPELLVTRFLVLNLAQIENLKEIKRTLSLPTQAFAEQGVRSPTQPVLSSNGTNNTQFEIFWALTLSQQTSSYLPGQAISFFNSLQCPSLDIICLRAKARLGDLIRESLVKFYSRFTHLKFFLVSRLSSQQLGPKDHGLDSPMEPEIHTFPSGALSPETEKLQTLLSGLISLPRASSEQYLEILSNKTEMERMQRQILKSTHEIFSKRKDLEEVNSLDSSSSNLGKALISTVHFFELLQIGDISSTERFESPENLSNDEVQFKNSIESDMDQTFSVLEAFINQTEFEL